MHRLSCRQVCWHRVDGVRILRDGGAPPSGLTACAANPPPAPQVRTTLTAAHLAPHTAQTVPKKPSQASDKRLVEENAYRASRRLSTGITSYANVALMALTLNLAFSVKRAALDISRSTRSSASRAQRAVIQAATVPRPARTVPPVGVSRPAARASALRVRPQRTSR